MPLLGGSYCSRKVCGFQRVAEQSVNDERNWPRDFLKVTEKAPMVAFYTSEHLTTWKIGNIQSRILY